MEELECVEFWEKCIELLVGHCPLLEVGDDPSHIPYGIVHAVTCCKVPNPSLVQVAVLLFPEQAWQRDEQGMIPLHHVLCNNHKYATTALLNILLTGEGSSQRNFQSTALIPFPNHGPTPLAFALKRGLPMDTVIEKLLEADSDVTLHSIDPSTQLYPFCLAALPSRRKEETNDDDHNVCSDDSLILEKQQGKIQTSLSKGNDTTSDASDKSSNNMAVCDEVHPSSSVYQVDDIFRLLLAHPQVLAQCTHFATAKQVQH